MLCHPKSCCSSDLRPSKSVKFNTEQQKCAIEDIIAYIFSGMANNIGSHRIQRSNRGKTYWMTLALRGILIRIPRICSTVLTNKSFEASFNKKVTIVRKYSDVEIFMELTFTLLQLFAHVKNSLRHVSLKGIGNAGWHKKVSWKLNPLPTCRGSWTPLSLQ